MIHPALKMYNYHVWANGVIIDRLKELPQGIYHKEIQSGFSSVSKVLSHIYLTDFAWFDIISGKSMNEAMGYTDQIRKELETKSIEEMEKKFLDLSDRNKAILNSQKDIEKLIVVDNPYAGLLETSISESIYTLSHTDHITVAI